MPWERLAFVRKPRWNRALRIAVAWTLVLFVALVLPPWLSALVPQAAVQRTKRMLLLAAEPAYGAALVMLVSGLVVLSPTVFLARKRGKSHSLAARFLLLCASGLLANILAEGMAAGWRSWTYRHPDFPVLRTDFRESGRDEVNIVVIGDSSAYGLPFEKWLSTGHIVTWKLGEAIPGRRFNLDILAEPGVHLEWMHLKLAGYERRPDLLIIYSGHNEFTYRYSWSRSITYYPDENHVQPGRLVKQVLEPYSPICGIIHEALETNGLSEPPPPEVTRQLVDVPVCTFEEYTVRLNDFRERLETIVAYCERVGTLAVLLIPPGNDAGFEPNRSVLPPQTTAAERQAFSQRFGAVRAGEATDPTRALESYRAIVADQPGFAEAHFRLARLLERFGKPSEASRHYRAARDLDGLPMRCPTPFQQVYREVAARHPNAALLVDGEAAIAGASPGGILGNRFFLDAMHPNVRGHALLARAILDALRLRRAFGWPERTPTPEVDPEECAAHFQVGAKAWEVACKWGATFFEKTAYIRYDPTERLAWISRYQQAARSIADGRDPNELGMPGVGVRPIAAPSEGWLDSKPASTGSPQE